MKASQKIAIPLSEEIVNHLKSLKRHLGDLDGPRFPHQQ